MRSSASASPLSNCAGGRATAGAADWRAWRFLGIDLVLLQKPLDLLGALLSHARHGGELLDTGGADAVDRAKGFEQCTPAFGANAGDLFQCRGQRRFGA